MARQEGHLVVSGETEGIGGWDGGAQQAGAL